MKQEILDLVKKFEKIRKLGYIKAINNYTSGGGLTLEKLLNANAGNLCYPDLNGIELKTINKFWKKNINLFCDTPFFPNIRYESSVKILVKKYGYHNKNYKKVFNGKINAKSLTQVGLLYYFRLKVLRKKEIIILQIFDLGKNLINEEIYWEFSVLKNKLETKLKYLALIYLEKKYINSVQYCKYTRMNLYILKDFNTFINLIEEGLIEVTFSTGYFKGEKNFEKFHDHGTKFTINEKDINKLFTKI